MPFGWENQFKYEYSHDGAIDARYDNPCKLYLPVLAKFDTDGSLVPVAFDVVDEYSGERKTVSIDRLVHVCKKASRKAGGAGWCFSVMIGGQQKDLYLEVDKWFLEVDVSPF